MRKGSKVHSPSSERCGWTAALAGVLMDWKFFLDCLHRSDPEISSNKASNYCLLSFTYHHHKRVE